MSNSLFHQLPVASCPQTHPPAHKASQEERITQPERLDVLCGKEKVCVQHEGSKRFRIVIESYRDLYAEALTKFDKMTITRGKKTRVFVSLLIIEYIFIIDKLTQNGRPFCVCLCRTSYIYIYRNLRSDKGDFFSLS